MKYLILVLSIFLAAVAVSAQVSPNSSQLTVIEKKWQVMPSAAVLSALNEDPFRANNETNQAIQDRKDDLRDNEIRRKQGLPLQPPRTRVKPVDAAYPTASSNSYTYRIKVRNDAAKTIQTVVWEYVFFNRTTKQETGRHQFTSKTNLKPGETDKLVVRYGSAPSSVVNAADAGRKPRDQFVEEVYIKSIQYADGSLWQADSK